MKNLLQISTWKTPDFFFFEASALEKCTLVTLSDPNVH